jgi:hypothetical protein
LLVGCAPDLPCHLSSPLPHDLYGGGKPADSSGRIHANKPRPRRVAFCERDEASAGSACWTDQEGTSGIAKRGSIRGKALQ